MSAHLRKEALSPELNTGQDTITTRVGTIVSVHGNFMALPASEHRNVSRIWLLRNHRALMD